MPFVPRVICHASIFESCLYCAFSFPSKVNKRFTNSKIDQFRRHQHDNKSITMKVSNKSMMAMCLAAVAFLLTTVHGHNYGRGYALTRRAYDFHRRSPSMDLMSDMFSIPVYFNSLMKQQREQASHYALSDPSYHVEELSTGEIELTVDVPGVAAADLNVELLEEGTLLRISGSRRHRGSVKEFDQLFRLNKDVDADNLSVRLADGVLRVVAPKKQRIVKKIPIVVEDEEKVVDVDAQVISDGETDEAEIQEKDGMTITTEE